MIKISILLLNFKNRFLAPTLAFLDETFCTRRFFLHFSDSRKFSAGGNCHFLPLPGRHCLNCSSERFVCNVCGLGTIPGPLLMGVIFDSTCMLWQPSECAGGARGSCMFYDNTGLSVRFLALCVGVSGVALVAMITGAACYRAPTASEPVVIRVNGDHTGGGLRHGSATRTSARRTR